MIKFRAWDPLNKIMITNFYRSYVQTERGRFTYRLATVSGNKIKATASVNSRERLIYHYSHDLVLMQSTGLKDKNGVDIYVGDIVILTSKSINYADTYWHNYAEVFQQSNGAYRLRGKGIYETELYGNRKQVTLTGNIYETPELLGSDRFCTETDDPDC